MPQAISEETIRQRIHNLWGDKIILNELFHFVNTKTKVTVVCGVNPEHGAWEARPETLTKSIPNGCPKCGFDKVSALKRSDLPKFSAAAQQVHGNKYDYSQTTYVNSRTKIVIRCTTCQSKFEMTPNHHLEGEGCLVCYRDSTRRDLEAIIAQAQGIHQTAEGQPLFDYSLMKKEEWKGTLYKVPIRCLTCNTTFQQSMNCHVHAKQGCYECNQRRSRWVPLEEMIARCQAMHQLADGTPRFDYSSLTGETYRGLNTNVELPCRGCNQTVKDTLDNHLSSYSACPRCSPPHGCSQSQLNWLNHVATTAGIYIQHKVNDGEYVIPSIGRVDGYCAASNIVYEFHGCFYHSCPTCFVKRDDPHPFIIGKTYQEVYERTIERDQRIRDLGYNLVAMWEHDWMQYQKENKVAVTTLPTVPKMDRTIKAKKPTPQPAPTRVVAVEPIKVTENTKVNDDNALVFSGLSSGLSTKRLVSDTITVQPTEKKQKKDGVEQPKVVNKGGVKAADEESVKAKILEIYADTFIIDKQFKYVNASTHVKVLCKRNPQEHGYFEVRPYALLKKNKAPMNCPQCTRSSNKDKFKESFITKCKTIYGDKYTYDEVVYVNNNTKVTIGCREGHKFDMTPDNHVNGHECPACWRRRQSNIDGYVPVNYTE